MFLTMILSGEMTSNIISRDNSRSFR